MGAGVAKQDRWCQDGDPKTTSVTSRVNRLLMLSDGGKLMDQIDNAKPLVIDSITIIA